jgi:hypothetical protein
MLVFNKMCLVFLFLELQSRTLLTHFGASQYPTLLTFLKTCQDLSALPEIQNNQGIAT